MFQYDLSRGDKSFRRFLAAQLNLFVHMCRGGNVKVIEALTGTAETQPSVNFDLIMCALNEDVLKSYPELRANFVQLLKGKTKLCYSNIVKTNNEIDACVSPQGGHGALSVIGNLRIYQQY